jgi:hypothetical protein
MLDGLRDDPARAAALDVTGAMVDAAFVRDMVEQHGLEDAVNVYVLKSFADLTRWFVLWRKSTNGVWWEAWYREANRFRRP